MTQIEEQWQTNERLTENLKKLTERVAQLEASKISSNAVLKVTSDSTENKKESEVALPSNEEILVMLWKRDTGGGYGISFEEWKARQ